MKIVVGLGNPGRTYRDTRHNVGWMVIERLAARHETALDRCLRQHSEAVAAYGECTIGGHHVRLVKPSTMMNRSGAALEPWRDQVAPEDVLLVCDDVNLALGRIRLRAQGGSGGHHGLESCFEGLGTDQVSRMRVGVGGGQPGADLTSVVLTSFAREERSVVEEMTGRAAEAVETWVEHGAEVAMNRFNPEQDTQ